jgi:hypothetical protein
VIAAWSPQGYPALHSQSDSGGSKREKEGVVHAVGRGALDETLGPSSTPKGLVVGAP